jgi:hypothetical protein
MRRLVAAVCGAILVTTLGLAEPVLAASVTNGGFETGTLGGWTVENQTTGDWYAYSGTTSPATGFTIPAPPEGDFAATSDGAVGSHLLYQDIVLEANARHTLTMIVYYRFSPIFSGQFWTPETLDVNVTPNQQYRIDVVDPSAPTTSVAPDDVLLRVFRTEESDPISLDPTRLTVDLTAFAGSTVRLRFAAVDNQGFLQAGVDDVRITSTPQTPQSKADCKNGGWRNVANDQGQSFRNHGQCVSYVVAHRR